jgi:hypothetical protein
MKGAISTDHRLSEPGFRWNHGSSFRLPARSQQKSCLLPGNNKSYLLEAATKAACSQATTKATCSRQQQKLPAPR